MGKIIIWIVGVIIVAGGAYFIYKNYSGATVGVQNQQQSATTTPVVQAQEVTIGTGAEAKPGSVVSVLYVGKLPDGTVFDSSAAHNNQPLTFQLGSQTLIAGFQLGVNGMREGGERLIAVPPVYGYGAQELKDPTSGKVIVPANSTLVFDIKLVKVEAASPAPAATPKKAQ